MFYFEYHYLLNELSVQCWVWALLKWNTKRKFHSCGIIDTWVHCQFSLISSFCSDIFNQFENGLGIWLDHASVFAITLDGAHIHTYKFAIYSMTHSNQFYDSFKFIYFLSHQNYAYISVDFAQGKPQTKWRRKNTQNKSKISNKWISLKQFNPINRCIKKIKPTATLTADTKTNAIHITPIVAKMQDTILIKYLFNSYIYLIL